MNARAPTGNALTQSQMSSRTCWTTTSTVRQRRPEQLEVLPAPVRRSGQCNDVAAHRRDDVVDVSCAIDGETPKFGVLRTAPFNDVARWRAMAESRDDRRLVFEHVGSFDAGYWAQEHGEEIVRRVSREMRTRGVGHVYGDQREALMLSAMFTRHGQSFHERPWTGPAKERAVTLVRAWLRDGTLVLPPHDGLRLELLSFEERIASSGALTFGGGRGTGGHDDFVSLLLTAAMAESDTRGRAPDGSPTRANRMAEALLSMTDARWLAEGRRAYPRHSRSRSREELFASFGQGTNNDKSQIENIISKAQKGAG